MSRSILWKVLVCVGLSLLSAPPTPSHAGSLSLGTHLSASVVRSGENKSSTGIWGIPSNVLAYQPAFRVAWSDPSHRHELFFDTGALAIDQAGSTLTLAVTSLGYQHVFMRTRTLSPIANAAVGISRESGAEVSYSPLFGLGIGVRHAVRDEHGALRVEVRWDQVGKDDTIGRPRLDGFGVRAGFDLWL